MLSLKIHSQVLFFGATYSLKNFDFFAAFMSINDKKILENSENLADVNFQ